MQTVRTGILATAIVALALASAPATAKDTEKKEVNLGFFGVSTNIDAKEIGLPIYPGSRPHKKDRDEDSSAKVWAGLGSFGFKVVVIELDSSDAPQKIAAFYRPMLDKFGTVLDCSAASAKQAGGGDDFLNCKDEHPKPGDILLKAGKHHEMRVVAAEHEGAGSKIALVYVNLTGISD